jgi:hypothetical protein
MWRTTDEAPAMLLLNTDPTISRTQLLTEQLCGAIRDHEAAIAKLHPRKLAYTGELLTYGQRFLDAIHDANREQAEATTATDRYSTTLRNAAQYAKDMRRELRAVAEQLKHEGHEDQARSLLTDYMTRSARLSIERPSDLRSIIEQYAHANAKHRDLLTAWGIDDAKLDQAASLARQITEVIQERRVETTQAELAVRTRDEAELAFIHAINPLLRRIAAQSTSSPQLVQAFESIIEKFRADLTSSGDRA